MIEASVIEIGRKVLHRAARKVVTIHDGGFANTVQPATHARFFPRLTQIVKPKVEAVKTEKAIIGLLTNVTF